MSEHTCHATGCEVPVPPKLFMCRKHWFSLPKRMRDAVWAEYRPGQEIRKDPTVAYLIVTREAIEWLAAEEGRRRDAQRTLAEIYAPDRERLRRR